MRFSTTFLISLAVAVSASAAVEKKEAVSTFRGTVPVASRVVTSFERSMTDAKQVSVQRPLETKRVALSSRAAGAVSYDDPTPFAPGLDAEGYSYLGLTFGSAYVDYTWTNTSTAEGPFTWTFADETIEGTDLTKNLYPYYWDYPTLTAADGSSYCNMAVSGANTSPVMLLSGGSMRYYLGEDATNGIGTYFNNDSENDGYSRYSQIVYPMTANYTSSLADQGLLNAKNVGFGNYFAAPKSTYGVSEVQVFIGYIANKDFPLTITVYEVDDEGYLGDAIAKGEAIVPASYTGGQEKENVNSVTFELYALDEDGLETEEAIHINTAVFVELTGYVDAEGLKQLKPLAGFHSAPASEYEANGWQATFGDKYTWNSYELISGEVDGEEGVYMLKTDGYVYSSDPLLVPTDFAFTFNAVFGFFKPVDNNYIVTVPEEGGEVTVEYDSYWLAGGLSFYLNEDAEYTLADILDEGQTENGISLTYVFDPLPDNIAGLEMPITVVAYGMDPVELKFVQGEASISGVSMDQAVQKIEYYDIMGRKLNAAPQNGLFIEKAIMTDGSVKATKINR